MPRRYITFYRGKDGAELSLGYRSFRVITDTRVIPEQEKVWGFYYYKEDFITRYNTVCQFQIWNGYWDLDNWTNDPFNPPISTDGLYLPPVFDIRPAGDNPYSDPRRGTHRFPDQVRT